jgi:signal transduction histidine kinase
MIYLGAALMVINIGSFISYARKMRNKQSWSEHYHILYIPIVLLVFFLLGYLFVGFFGKPDLMVAGILFFGSVFVFVMYKLIDRITALLMKSQQYEAELLAAEKANRTKTELLASVSHEMRTPMNVIIGLDKIALSEPGMSDTTKDHL